MWHRVTDSLAFKASKVTTKDVPTTDWAVGEQVPVNNVPILAYVWPTNEGLQFPS
jgi:hypothetical protein